VWQSRPIGANPRALGQMPQQQPRSPMEQQSMGQQPRSPVGQQPRSPVSQKPRSPIAQQPHSPIARHARPPGNRQVHVQPQFTQPHPHAANARLSRQPEATLLNGGGGGRKPANKPSKLSLASHSTWGDQQPELAPGAIQSPAEFPPLGAPATTGGKRQQQQSGPPRQIWRERKERPQVPSNSIRDLSTRQAKRTEEITFVEGKLVDLHTHNILECNNMSSPLFTYTCVVHNTDEPAPQVSTSPSEVTSGTDSESEVTIHP
jgi:hypothetical protein